MKMKNIIRLFPVWLLLFATNSIYAQENPGQSQGDPSSSVYVRYEPAPGTSKWIKAKAAKGSVIQDNVMVKVRDQYMFVDSSISSRFKKKSCATYWYDMEPESEPNHYVIRSHTIKNAIGISSSFMFKLDKTKGDGWLMDEYQNDFGDASYWSWGVSGGLLYARQLCAKNRHRLSVEVVPAYQQIRETFSANRYSTHHPAIDPDGYGYERLISITDYKEKVENHCLSIPFDLRYDLFVLNSLSVFMAGGLDNLFIISRKSDVSFGASYAGQYGEELFNTLVDENGYYDFGQFPDNHVTVDKDVAFRYNLYATAKLGAQYFVVPMFSVELAILYDRLLYSSLPVGQTSTFCLSESAGTYQSMAYSMKQLPKNRLGINLTMKINF